MTHTPGPWIRSKHSFNVLTADSMRSIAAVHAIHPGHSSAKDIEEHIANARLIAAAPELLAALKQVMVKIMDEDAPWWITCPDKGGFDTKALAELIDKAEGREP